MNKTLRVALLAAGLLASSSSWALFGDDEARRAILELRQRVDTMQQDYDQKFTDQGKQREDDGAQLRRSMLDLQNQIEALRADYARLQGQNEQLSRDLSEAQRQIKDSYTGLDERLRKFEPSKVSVDGREFNADSGERRDYEAAMAIFRKGDFTAAEQAYAAFIQHYPNSGYVPSSFFWLGNAQYANREYKEAVQNFRSLLTTAPDHLRAPEAVLSIANCQVELKDVKAARKTLEDLIKAYPQSDAAAAAKQRLARLK